MDTTETKLDKFKMQGSRGKPDLPAARHMEYTALHGQPCPTQECLWPAGHLKGPKEGSVVPGLKGWK